MNRRKSRLNLQKEEEPAQLKKKSQCIDMKSRLTLKREKMRANLEE